MTSLLSSTSGFWPTLLLNAIWVNASEIFRYFVFVMPMMRAAFPQIDNVAPMSWQVFALWGVWDTILVFSVTGFVWLILDRFGDRRRNAIVAGTLFWLSVFVILWLGIWNMNLTTPAVVTVALLLSWLEMVVAALIVNWGRQRFGR